MESFPRGLAEIEDCRCTRDSRWNCRYKIVAMQPPGPVDVTLALALRSYQKTIVSTLWSAGMLRRVLSLGPELQVQDPRDDGSLEVIKRFPVHKLSNRLLWGIWRRLPRKTFRHPPIAPTSWLADSLLSNWIEPTAILHASTAFCLSSIRAAKRKSAVTLVESGTRHPRLWRQSALEECRRFGVDDLEGGAGLPDFLIRRMDREFEACDWIVVPSNVARQSFTEMGHGDKTVVVLPGVDTQFFSPPPRPAEAPLFRACYVGRVQVTKGVGYLLQAWKRLALSGAELVLIGEVSPDIRPFLKTYVDSSVRIVEKMSPEEIAACYRESSLFVFPSVSEGLAEELLEAMASGLPIVASDMSGATDCIVNGEQGWIVPTRDVDALADTIRWCFKNPNESRAMGLAARARIEDQFTLVHYNQRLIACYKSLVGGSQTALTDEHAQLSQSQRN
jgi:starch synthase